MSVWFALLRLVNRADLPCFALRELEFGDQMDGALAGAGRCLAAIVTRRRRSPLHLHRQWLLQLVAEEPDVTLIEVRDRLAERGQATTEASV